MLIFDSISKDLISVTVTIFVLFIAYYKWATQYWKRKNLPTLEATFPFGSMKNPLTHREQLGLMVRKFYDDIKRRNWKHGGAYFFSNPVYIPTDLDYVKNVMSKDFQHFVDRGIYYNEKDDPITAHLFAVGGTKWRNLRTKLSPTFTSGKMKMMFQTLLDCEANLQEKIEIEYENSRPIDIKELAACFTIDIIGSCAFGLDCNSFKDEDSLFRSYGQKIFTWDKFRFLKLFFSANFPDIAKKLRLRVIPQDISNFFMKVVKDTINYRETNKYTRKDFLQLLIDLKHNNDGGFSLTPNDMVAQCFVFFLAGHETSATTMTFALYELSKHQDVQDKVRTEIDTVLEKYDGKITYEAIQDMKYMDQVIDETLRKYPPAPVITRVCVKDYKVPNEDVVIEKGTNVFISIFGIHHDEKYYPEPEKFDPERFTEENKSSRHHFAHIPFGEGPRLCIGMRFGLMQTKIGLTSLLRKYQFSVNKKTQDPLEFKVDSIVLAAKGDVWLNIEKI